MNHPFPPPAPPPPPAGPHGGFPGMGMGMEHMVDNFAGTHIETIEPRFDHGSFDERAPRPIRGSNPRRASEGNAKSLTSYEGYIFTKMRAEHAGQKETWAYARKTTMPVSQGDMRDQVAKQYKRGLTGMKQFEAQEMAGFKRRQIERLIDDRARRDDPNFEYTLVSVKLEQRRLRSGSYENSAMRVILKRQLRPGVPFHPAMPAAGAPSPSNEVVDLTGQDESERSSMNSFGSSPKMFGGSPKHHAGIPLPRQHSEPWGHGGHGQPVMEDAFMPMHQGRPLGEEQDHGNHQDPHFFAEENFHEDHGGKAKKDDKKDKHGKGEKGEKGEKHEKKDKHDKHDKKEARPTIIHVHSHKSDKKHHSDTSSLDSDWDHVSGHTEDTFESIPSHSSSASKTYKKEKKHDKAEKHKSHSHHGSHDREATRPLYREHTRKVPERPREVSPAPSRRSGHSGRPRYVDEDVIIQPEVSHRGGRDHYREPRQRHVSYSRERPRGRPHRSMSYDDEAPFDMEYDAPPRSNAAYGRNLARTPKAPQVDYEKEMLRLELERQRMANDKLDRELDRTTAELHRTASARMPIRERIPMRAGIPRREMRPPIIERDSMPLPRRRPEPAYEYYDDEFY